MSPIMMAVKWGHLESVKCLASVPGVDLGTRDKEGNTLIDMARRWSVMVFLGSLLLERKWHGVEICVEPAVEEAVGVTTKDHLDYKNYNDVVISDDYEHKIQLARLFVMR